MQIEDAVFNQDYDCDDDEKASLLQRVRTLESEPDPLFDEDI